MVINGATICAEHGTVPTIARIHDDATLPHIHANYWHIPANFRHEPSGFIAPQALQIEYANPAVINAQQALFLQQMQSLMRALARRARKKT